MDKSRRKELTRAFKERKQTFGIFAVHCKSAEKIWVAATRNLEGEESRLRFMLRHGGTPNRAMTEAWNVHGGESFSYEVLEEVTDENPLLLDSLLRDRAAHWLKELKARPIVD
jgi:hypothetical protein